MNFLVKKILDNGFQPKFKTKDGIVFNSINGVVVVYNDGDAEGFLKNNIKESLNINESFITSVGLVLITALGITYFTTDITIIDGSSMHPNYKNHEIVLRSKKTSEVNKMMLNKNSVVKFISPEGDQCIKRIIALPGDTIEFDVTDIFVNGKLVDTQNVNPNKLSGTKTIKTKRPGVSVKTKNEREIQILNLKNDEYFVIGDNRLDSTDSRSFGPIKYTSIVRIIDK